MNQFESEDRLVGALRRLAEESSRVPSPEVAAGLAAAFRRHHRRRRTRNAVLVVLAICSLASVALFLTRQEKAAPVMVKNPSSPVTSPVVESATPTPASSTMGTANNPGSKKAAQRDVRQRAVRYQTVASQARQSLAFLPLPSYDPAVRNDELRIVRVEMPIQDLRLVGAPVAADVPNRQVRADFVVGHDGTPYAVRLIQ